MPALPALPRPIRRMVAISFVVVLSFTAGCSDESPEGDTPRDPVPEQTD